MQRAALEIRDEEVMRTCRYDDDHDDNGDDNDDVNDDNDDDDCIGIIIIWTTYIGCHRPHT